MNDVLFSQMAASFYLISALLYFLQFFIQSGKVSRFAVIFTVAGFVLHSAGIFLRWTTAGRLPLATFYESLIFFAWTIILINLFIEIKYAARQLSVLLLTLSCLIMGVALFSPLISSNVEPLLPALKSGWLYIHVSTCIAGFAAFAVTFALGLLYFIKKITAGKNDLALAAPALLSINVWIFRFSRCGLLFLTVGIVTGAAWAHTAWGSYWSWDPKETCALIAWIIYALLLHLKLLRIRGKNAPALLAVAGFLWVIFTYWGSFIFSSLHSYN